MYMKNAAMLAALLCFALAPAAYADGSSANAGSSSTSASGSAADSRSVANSSSGASGSATSGVNASQGQNTTMTLNQNSPKQRSNTPDVFAPQINNTAPCMRSLSGGASVAGFGVSFGAGDEDMDCNTRENVILLHNLGRDDIAMQYYCDNESEVKAAAAKLNVSCPMLLKLPSVQTTAEVSDNSGWFNPGEYHTLHDCLVNAEPRSTGFAKKAELCTGHSFPKTVPRVRANHSHHH